jgi:nucleotide-binding universal stress UspA family protein
LHQFPDLLREDVARCLREAVQQRIDEWANTCMQEGLTVRTLVADSRIQCFELLDIAHREKVSLIVLGPRAGKDPGPTAYFAMHSATSSLLILKAADLSGQELYRDSCQGIFARPFLPTDWSDCALRAEHRVIELKKAGAEEVTLAHVLEPGVKGTRREEIRLHIQRRLAHSCRTLEEAGLKVHSLFLEGDPSHAIVEAAERENASLITMGSTGKSVMEEQLVGIISERVALMSNRSVLLVH